MRAASYHTITWRGDLALALRQLAELGFRTFEAGNLQNWFARRDELDALVADLDIRPVSLYVGGAYVYEEDRDMELAIAEAACKFLQSYGCEHLVIGGGHVKSEGPSDEDYECLAEVLQMIGMLAHDSGLQVCYHPHVGTMVETPDQVTRVAELTDPELVSFCIDVAHVAAAGGDPLEVCQTHRDRLRYVHLKDLDNGGRFVELGKGEVDLAGILGFLREEGFDGPVTLELDFSDDPKGSAERNRDYAIEKLGLEL